MGDVSRELGQRAVQAVEQSAREGREEDDTLSTLIAPDATFRLIIGDVGRPFAAGPKGMREFAQAVNPLKFRYWAWSTMPTPADLCGPHEIQVEFETEAGSALVAVTFKFVDGKIESAEGWRRAYVGGLIRK